MDVREFVSYLRVAKGPTSSGEYLCKCPAHGPVCDSAANVLPDLVAAQRAPGRPFALGKNVTLPRRVLSLNIECPHTIISSLINASRSIRQLI